jgi:branched-chain amino acid transport system substrate-binding protein
MTQTAHVRRPGASMSALAVLGVAAAMLVSACGSPASSAGPTGSAADGPKEPIVVGGIVPLTGAYAADGLLQKRGLELAVADLNAAGGVLGRPVQLELFDIQDQLPENIKAAADQLLGKLKVDAVFDGYAGYGPEWLEFGANSDVPFLRGDGSSKMDEMTAAEPDLYWNTFGMYQTEPEYGGRAAEGLLSFGDRYQFPNNKIALVHGDIEWDLKYTKGIADVFVAEGWEVVLDETVPYGTTDWGSILTKIRAAEPAVIALSILSVQDTSTFVKQFMQAPTSSLLDISYMNSFVEVRDAVGPEIAGVMGYLTSKKVDDEAWLARYEQAFGEPYIQHMITPGMYDQVGIWAAAVEAVGDPKDYKAIADHIRTTKYTGLQGTYDFNNPGQTAHETPELPIGYSQSAADGSLRFFGTDEFVLPPYIQPAWPMK